MYRVKYAPRVFLGLAACFWEHRVRERAASPHRSRIRNLALRIDAPPQLQRSAGSSGGA